MGVWNLNEKGMGGVSIFDLIVAGNNFIVGWGSFCTTKYVGGSWERDIFCAYYRTREMITSLTCIWGVGYRWGSPNLTMLGLVYLVSKYLVFCNTN